ncbi:MAG TPA: sigma-E processing peptidase SpoIIGA [Syntrophomonadaceae bacterium]|nr:sigma-E processing peptidase SpoIIGA [Syntrophomonadaceae bacterium]
MDTMPGRPYIYVDILFIVNFVMDYIALWATARLSQIRCVPWRLATAACLGSCYSIFVLLPGLGFLTAFWVKFLVSLLMLVVAFIPFHIKKFGRVLLYFYLIAFTMGGTVLGFIYLMSNFSINPSFSNLPIPYLWLALGLGIAILLGKWGVPSLKKSFLRDLLRVPVIIKVGGRELKITGLVDTGNQLVDPLTGAPVVIVEHEVIAPYLPPNTRDLFGAGGELEVAKLSSSFREDGEVLPFRLIPFTTIGKHHGMLVGFKPEEITILAGDQEIRNTNVVICLYNRRLSPRGAYRALIHPDLLHTPAGA